MSSSISKVVFVMALAVAGAACSTDEITVLGGTTPPITNVSLNTRNLSPATDTLRRGTVVNYSFEATADYRTEDFHSPHVDFVMYGMRVDNSGNETVICKTTLKSIVPTNQNEKLVYTGSFTVPTLAQCALATHLDLEVDQFSGTSGQDSDFKRYLLK